MKMLKIILVLFLMTVSVAVSAQSDRWSSIQYNYSNGPVSPEYQYNYSINLNDNLTGQLIYTKNGKTDEYDFTFSKKNLKKLNKALKKSKVFNLSQDDLKIENGLIGGSERSLMITKWQSPELDAKPEVVSVPSQVKEIYSEGINNLYKTIEKIVPQDIRNKIK